MCRLYHVVSYQCNVINISFFVYFYSIYTDALALQSPIPVIFQ